jgi:predicted KAP-like P-loop ATPase
LKNENLKLCKQIAKFKAENTTLKSQITLITKEYTQYRHDNPPFDPSTISEEDRKMLDEVAESVIKKLRHKNQNNLT